MGLTVYVFRSSLGDCTNGGVSSQHDRLTVVNVQGPSEPTADAPAVLLVDGPLGSKHLAPAVLMESGEWGPALTEGVVGPMAGGNFAQSSDSRFAQAAGFYGAVSVHDRYETPEQYASMSY